MTELESIIAKGRFHMLDYLEGRLVFINGQWQQVTDSWVQGRYAPINLLNHEIGVLEDFCRNSREG